VASFLQHLYDLVFVFWEHLGKAVRLFNKITGHSTDAPSLKKADCGIAVEGASEAAQSASDIVFLEPGTRMLSLRMIIEVTR
jgi:high-affinity K+ transport system ATPase subunit B